ncbi:hypothetical protein GCM10009682_58810 [Luedemannella flava]|uniref:Phage gp6-like head-tail connector protein n=1 Tax=Luedemannella flava TaxID=349316 RepID=A0ABN2MND3_9ACTN
MSTFMAFASVDLRSAADADAFLAALRDAVAANRDADRPLQAHLDGARATLHADYGNIWLGHVLARVAENTGVVRRAVLALDHDEYGAEHVVLDGTVGGLRRVQHVYVFPHGEPDEDLGLTIADVPAHPDVPAGDNGMLDGPAAWAVAAALYDVPVARLAAAARRQETAYEHLGAVFSPFEGWWDALGAPYAGGPGGHVVTIGG